MQTQTCMLQKSVKIHIYLSDISLKDDLVYQPTKWAKWKHNSIPPYHLHTSNDAEEIYKGKFVQLIVART